MCLIVIKKSVVAEVMHEDNDMLCYRYPNFKRKRRDMEASTPVSERRETLLIDMEDSSPINKSDSIQSEVSLESSDNIPTEKMKAGLSDEIVVMNMTPPKELSPDTMDRKLALHCVDIVKAGVNNDKVMELQEHESHAITLSENPFSKKDTAVNVNGAAGMDEMNKTTGGVGEKPPSEEGNGTVDMDEMNKTPAGVDLSPTREGGNGAVGMDEMNKTPLGVGGESFIGQVEFNATSTSRGAPNVKRLIKFGGRKLSTGGKKEKLDSRLIIGVGASGAALSVRGCPEGQSPKRPSNVDINQVSSATKRRRRGKKALLEASKDQQTLTKMWKKN